MLCAGPLPACGAFGMLAIGADALETAAVLAGGGLTLRSPRVLPVTLAGRLSPGVGGADLALALLARLRESAAAADVVEFGGEGAGALPMAERVSAAWLLAQAGLPSLFPSDETTRAALAALGRDQDWRRLDASGRRGAGVARRARVARGAGRAGGRAGRGAARLAPSRAWRSSASWSGPGPRWRTSPAWRRGSTGAGSRSAPSAWWWRGAGRCSTARPRRASSRG